MKSISLILIFLPFFAFSQTQIGQDIDGETEFDQSGSSISLSSNGNIVAIGSIRNDANGEDSGHVRVFENQGGNWIQIGQDIDGEGAGDFFGKAVCLSSNGNRVAIGASSSIANVDSPGQVNIFENQGGSWIQVGQDIDGELPGDSSGFSVSLSSNGNIVAIGAIFNNGNNTGSDAGHVRVYENQGGSWIQVGQDIDGEAVGDHSGISVSLSSNGNIIAVGANINDGNSNFSGHVRIYQNQGGSWIQVGQDVDGEAESDRSGSSVSLSSNGSIVAIGAVFNDGNGNGSGHVRVYENQSGNWVQIGQDIDGEAIGDHSGSSVSLSSNGNIVAIGAPLNDGNGNFSGHVRIYQNQDGSWIQVGQDIDGEAVNDVSGRSVSLSLNGNIIAVGANGNSGNGFLSGHARVFDLSGLLNTEEATITQFSIYPNPANTEVRLLLDENISLEKVTIYTNLGQLIKTSDIATLDISDLSQGIYIIKVTTTQGIASQKLIIE